MAVLHRLGLHLRLLIVTVFLIAACAQTAQAAPPIFSEDFSNCTTPQIGPDFTGPVGGGMTVEMYTSVNCPSWSGSGWLAVVTDNNGSSLAPVGDKAIWLNETGNSFTRNISGFVRNQAYRMEILVWNDDRPNATALDVKVGANAPVNFPLAAGEGAGARESNFCFLAPETSFDLRLSEAGSSDASPVVSSVMIYPLADISNCVAPPEPQDPSNIINGYMIHRATQLLQHQPDLIGLLSDDRAKTCGFDINAGAGQLDCTRAITQNIWVKAVGSWGHDGASQIDYGLLSFGGHHRINDDLILGVMAQFDHARDATDTSTVSGNGWLAGPYLVAKLPDTDLYVEGRILAGRSTNSIAPDNTYSDQFLTQRALAQVKVQGKVVFDPVTLEPFAIVSYTQDRQFAYMDSGGFAVPEHLVSLGQTELGLRARLPIRVAAGALEATVALSSISTARSTPYELGQRAKAQLGMIYRLGATATLDGSLACDVNKDYRMLSAYLGYKQAF